MMCVICVLRLNNKLKFILFIKKKHRKLLRNIQVNSLETFLSWFKTMWEIKFKFFKYLL